MKTNDPFQKPVFSKENSRKRLLPIFGFLLTLITVGVFAFRSGLSTGSELGYEKGYGSGFKSGEVKGETTAFQKEFLNVAQLYQQSNLNKMVELAPLDIELDHRGLVRKLTKVTYNENKDSASEVFSEILHTVHAKLLSNLSGELKLAKEDSITVQMLYDSIHPTLSDNYQTVYNKAIEAQGAIDPVLKRDAYTAANQFNATISESFCSLVEIIAVLAVLKKPVAVQKSNALASGAELFFAISCSDLLNSIFPKLSLDFREAGAFVDMQNFKMVFDNYIRTSIAEIATVEEVIREIKITKEVERKVLEKYQIRKLIGNAFDSKATVEMNASARLKAGIAIDDYFEYIVYPDKALIDVTVCNPKVLSREIFPSFSNIENGYLVKVDENMLNEAKDDIYLEIARIADEGTLLKSAQHNFEQFFEAVIMPTLKHGGIRNVVFNYVDPKEIKKSTAVKHLN